MNLSCEKWQDQDTSFQRQLPVSLDTGNVTPSWSFASVSPFVSDISAAILQNVFLSSQFIAQFTPTLQNFLKMNSASKRKRIFPISFFFTRSWICSPGHGLQSGLVQQLPLRHLSIYFYRTSSIFVPLISGEKNNTSKSQLFIYHSSNHNRTHIKIKKKEKRPL